MHAATNRLEFAPPATPGLLRSVALAVLAHSLLVAALTWGVSWKHDAQIVAVEAELWSTVQEQAAPPLAAEPPPPAPPVPVPVPEPEPAKIAPLVSNADIALEREKEHKAKEKLLKEKLEKEKRDKEKLALEKKAAGEKKQKELEAQKKEQLKTQQEAKLTEKRRQENIQRMTGLAGASGSPSATGTALKSTGPSASYAGRIIARVKPNIVFTEDISGNPSAEVEVRTALDGTIMSQRLVKASGNKAWDDAVVKAIIRTEKMPRDVDGRVPTPMILEFRPKD